MKQFKNRFLVTVVCLVMMISVLAVPTVQAAGDALYSDGLDWPWALTKYLTSYGDWYYPDTNDLHGLCALLMHDICYYGRSEMKTIMDQAIKNNQVYFGVDSPTTYFGKT